MVNPGLSRREAAKPPDSGPAGDAAEERSRAVLLWLLPAIGWYALLLTAGGSFGLFSPLAHGLTFNSMLLHLLRGPVRCRPGGDRARRLSARRRGLRLFRHPAGAVAGAVPVFAGFRDHRFHPAQLPRRGVADGAVQGAFGPHRLAERRPHRALRYCCGFLVLALLFGGPQVQFLRPSIFMESVLWAGAFAAAFVFLVLRGWTREAGFTAGLMSAAALVAGLCLLTRVSTGVGLYVALGLIWLWRLRRKSAVRDRIPPRRWLALASPMLVLLVFAALAGFVNQQRWGNPLVFVDLSRALICEYFPERLRRLREYGEFNPIRLGFGLVYYFLPIWVLRDGSGQLLWSDFVERTIDLAELPPSSFFVSDPLIIGLAIYGLFGLARDRVPRRAPIALDRGRARGPGAADADRAQLHLPIPDRILSAARALRFRRILAGADRAAAPGRSGLGGGAAASVVAAHALWLLNAMSPLGPASRVLGQAGILEFYGSVFH